MNLPFKLVSVDVDGCLTNGTYTVSQSGERTKTFHTRDFYAIEQLLKEGITVIIMTSSNDGVIDAQVQRLTQNWAYHDYKFFLETNEDNKPSRLKEYFTSLGVTGAETLYIGDAENDIEAMKLCSYRACPVDAIQELTKVVYSAEKNKWVISSHQGGNAVVYDIWKKFQGMYP